MITLFDIYNGAISGTNTSIIDLYFNLSSRYNIELKYKLTNAKHFRRIFFDIKKSIHIKPEKIISNFSNTIESDIVIMSSEILTHKHNKIKFNIICDKLILLDTTGISIAIYNNRIDEFFVKDDQLQYNEIILLGNPANKIASKYVDKFINYYHKFSINRLEYIKSNAKFIDKHLTTKRNINENEYAHMATFKSYFGDTKVIDNCDLNHLNIKNSNLLPHGCKSYQYQRWIQIVPKTYLENIGKLIFEFCYLNKPVYYSIKNKTINDGLHYYLKLFNVDDNINQILNITKEEIIEKLVFNDNDKILELL